MFLVLGIALAIFALFFLRFQYDFIRAVWLSLKIPGPFAWPIVGNGLIFINKTETEMFLIFFGLIKKYGDFVRLWLGLSLTVIVRDPKDAEILLTSTKFITKSSEYEFLKEWLNDGLLLSTGKKWQNRRKILTPAFHFNILEKFTETFDRTGNILISKLNRMIETEESIEFYPIAALYALDVICETAMGINVDALSKPNSEYVNAVKKIVYAINSRMTDFLLRNPYLYKFSNSAKTQSDAVRVLHGFTESVIRKRKHELSVEQNDNAGQCDEIGIRKKRALLDLLLQSEIDGKPLSDLDIREEVDTFMFEGHDTTTSGITFALYNIAKYAEVQRKCLKEIVDVCGSDTEESKTITQLNQLSYLELVIKESLRLYPSVPVIGRYCNEEIELTNNRIIPKSANICIYIYYMNRNEKYFENPDEFIPERFLGEQTMEKRNAFAYIPFSAGPRNCIGQKFAMYEMKSVLSKIVHNFEVTLTKDSEAFPTLNAALVLRPANSIRFYFKPRAHNEI